MVCAGTSGIASPYCTQEALEPGVGGGLQALGDLSRLTQLWRRSGFDLCIPRAGLRKACFSIQVLPF